MKNKILLKGLSAFAAVSMMTACSSDYLDLSPITDIGTDQATATVESCQQMLYGVCTAMQCQYQGTNMNQINGETYVNSLLNDCFGQDVILGLGIAQWGSDIMKMEWSNYRDLENSVQWMYLYNIINRANGILDGIDNAEGDDDLRAFVKAQALTFRAFAYTKLLMFYAPRWEDSNNGEKYCIVLRLKQGTDPTPLVKMKDVVTQIRTDLDDAIALYDSTEAERSYKWEPDESVAKGVYARLALLTHDWATAQKMAHEARQGYPVMSNDTYLSGFYQDNDELMWTQGVNDSDIYYWSWGSHFAANGQYVFAWGVGGGAIDMNLYRQLDENDIRRKCYVTPDKYNDMPANQNPGKVTEEDFWNPNLVDASNYLNLAYGPYARGNAVNGKWGVYNVAIKYCVYYLDNIFKGNKTEINNEGFMAYYSQGNSGDLLIGNRLYGTLKVTPLGAQLKFLSYGPYGTSAYPFMRGSEMCLAEAEAAYMNGDAPTALACLKEINGKRIPGYSFSATDESLLEEIKLCRRIELWGEGQSWSDFKRWNMPIKRVAWEANKPESGNWLPSVAGEYPTTLCNGWRFTVPSTEVDYNPEVDQSLLYD